MSNSLALYGLEALEVQYALCILVACGVTLLACLHVCHACLQNTLHAHIESEDVVHQGWTHRPGTFSLHTALH